MQSEVRIPKASLSLSGKRRRNPGILVRVIPQSDTHTISRFYTCGNRICIICPLLGKSGCCWRETCESDIKLCVCDFDAEGSESLQVGDLGGERWSFSDDEMGLEAYTVNFDAAGFERGDEVLGCSGFCAGVFDIVVIVVELYLAVVEGGSFEGDGDVFWSDL